MEILNLSEILDLSIEILRKYVKTIVMFTLGFGVVFVILAILFTIIIALVIGLGIGVGGFIDSNSAVIGILVGMCSIVLVAFYLTSNVGLIKIASQDLQGKRIYASEAIQFSFKSFFRVLGILMLAILLLVPVVGLGGLVIYLLYPAFTHIRLHSQMPQIGILFTVLGGIALILFLLFLIFSYFALFSFSLPAVVLERKGVLASVKRSFLLVKGNFRRILGSLVMIFLVLSAIRFSLQSFLLILTGLAYYVMKLLNISIEYTRFMGIVSLFTTVPMSLVFYLFIAPLPTLMITRLYLNERFKNEGYDIQLTLEGLKLNAERKQDIEYSVSDSTEEV